MSGKNAGGAIGFEGTPSHSVLVALHPNQVSTFSSRVRYGRGNRRVLTGPLWFGCRAGCSLQGYGLASRYWLRTDSAFSQQDEVHGTAFQGFVQAGETALALLMSVHRRRLQVESLSVKGPRSLVEVVVKEGVLFRVMVMVQSQSS